LYYQTTTNKLNIMSIQISISDVRESLQVFANGNTANAFTVVRGTKAVFAQKDADILADKIFKLGTFDLPEFVDNDEFVSAFRAFFAANNITRSAIINSTAKFTMVLEVYNCKISPCYSCARIHVYCTISATTFFLLQDVIQAQATQEAAELDQQQAEYEAAQAENEAEEVVALPENITFADTDTPEDQQFWKPDYYGRKLYNNGYITYIWGSYHYGANCRGGLVYCGDAVIAEDVESAQDAYEIAREHFYNWEYAQMQSAQQSDANTPQVADISADITYININQSPDLGETTAEQMQDNTPQEDAGTSEPFLKLAHPESLTDTEIADFFEEFDIDTYGGFKIGSGGSMWKFVPANIEAEEQTVIFYFKNPYSFDCGVLILAEYFQFKEAEYRAAYTAFYEHHQKVAGVPMPQETAAAWGLRTDLETDERDVDYILHFDIRCACVGILGEYLDNARIVKWYRKSTKQVLFKAYQEVGGQLICIENVIYLYPKTDLNLHRAMRAELDRQANLTKNSNN
jgi:hypothetical protein